MSASTQPTDPEAAPTTPKPDRFCIHPWSHLEITSQGYPIPCCIFEGGMFEDDTPLSVYTHSLEQIWNSQVMRDIRRDMVQGKGVAGCAECYRQEAAGNLSYRQRLNANWERGWLNPRKAPLAETKAQAVADDFVVRTRPGSYQLDTGSLCNLKCRMCCSFSSTRIERDAVHSGWADQWGPPEERVELWYKNQEFIQNQLLRHPEEIRYLYFVGGEPFLIKEIGDILQALIDAGVSRRVIIGIQTNGTTVKAPWLKLTEAFRRVKISVSLDGFGDAYEYIRYPAHWADVAANLHTLKQLPRVVLQVGVTLQAYNLLNIVDLLHYLDANQVRRFSLNTLTSPPYLRPSVLPPRARQLALERLRSYAAHECRPRNRKEVQGVIGGLEAHRDRFDAKLLREFMLFTNDLDVSRGQDFRTVHRELADLLAGAGFAWTGETLHARRTALPLL